MVARVRKGAAAFALVLALPGLLLLTHCQRCNEEQAPAPVSSQSALPPVAPKGLLADLVAPAPERLWRPLRELAGRYQGALPLHLSVALVRRLELPVELAGTLDTARPVQGMLLSSSSGTPDLVLAVPVSSGRELVARLTTGQAPLYRSRSSRGVALLEPSKAGANQPLAVFRNKLVFGTTSSELESAARYLVESVARRPVPRGLLGVSVGQAQLEGALGRLLRQAWEGTRGELAASEQRARAKQQGKSPDFGEPAAVRSALDSGVNALLALGDSARKLELVLTEAAGYWSVRAELVPETRGAAQDWVSEQVMGSLEPLERLPAATALALLSRSRGEQRSRGAREVAEQMAALFGARLGDREQLLLTSALQHLAAGRGDESTLAFIRGPAAGVVAQGQVADSERFLVALTDLPQLLSVGAVKAPLEEFLGPLRLRPIAGKAAGGSVVGHALTFGHGGQIGKSVPTGLEMLWHVERDRYHVVLGPSPAAPLLAASRRPKSGLGELQRVREALEQCQAASLAILLRPAALGLVPEQAVLEDAAVLVATGRERDRGFLTASVPSDVLQSFVEAAAAP